jgi:hypothetical protein
MIPKFLWQTYKTKLPANQSARSIKSWFDVNPGIEWFYMDDDKCDRFIKENFSQEFYDMYVSLPIGVMKADVWRIAIIYVYGGIYADLDTICLRPIEDWIKDEYELVVGVETHCGRIANFLFAAAPKHPAIYTALETVMKNYNDDNYLNKKESTATPVQNFGADAFSTGILKHYGLLDHMHLGGEYYNTVDKVQAEGAHFYPYGSGAFVPFPVEGTFVHHQTASVFWKYGYESWREEQRNKLGV